MLAFLTTCLSLCLCMTSSPGDREMWLVGCRQVKGQEKRFLPQSGQLDFSQASDSVPLISQAAR